LYYRLNVISLRLPALRERVQDIGRLAMLHLGFLAAHAGKQARSFSADALAAMQSYGWPGNLRELRNVIERAIILSEGEVIESKALSESIPPPQNPSSPFVYEPKTKSPAITARFLLSCRTDRKARNPDSFYG
jgi:DNA-binding NtrC family response regulator